MESYGKLLVSQAGAQEQAFELARDVITLGRAEGNDIPLNDAKVSRNHARLECGPGGVTLVDLGSANGTRLNGEPVSRVLLKPGDMIAIGNTSLRFSAATPLVEPDLTIMDSLSDFEATLAQESFGMTLNDTSVPRLAIHTANKTWEVPLLGDGIVVGRQAGSDIHIDHPKVSRRHAVIERRGEEYILRDLESANGTFLGSQRIEERLLQQGDSLRIGPAQIIFKRGFETGELTVVDQDLPLPNAVRTPVVIVPGLMGSELWRGSEPIWPNVRTLFTKPEILQLPDETPLEPRGLVNEVVIVPNLIKQAQYNRLGDYLEEGLGYERGKDLLEFAYDWRQDLRQSARRLAQTIDDWGVTAPVTLIGHSLGCLVSRYYVRRAGGRRKVGRLVLLGGPHGGAPKAVASLLMGPNLLPFGLLGDRLRQVMATFPSTYQILPQYPCVYDQEGKVIDIFKDESWLDEAHRPLLRDAVAFWKEMGTGADVPAISIFGYGQKTTTRLNIRRDGDSWHEVNFVTETSGDLTVPEQSAILAGSEIHPVQQGHGSLYIDNDVKMRLKFELTRDR
jgi:pSer/pThr/pTyr-binding forkhead associated (FHA) protein